MQYPPLYGIVDGMEALLFGNGCTAATSIWNTCLHSQSTSGAVRLCVTAFWWPCSYGNALLRLLGPSFPVRLCAAPLQQKCCSQLDFRSMADCIHYKSRQWASREKKVGLKLLHGLWRIFFNGNSDFIHWVISPEAYNSRSAPHSAPWKQRTKQEQCKGEFDHQLWKTWTSPSSLGLKLSLFPSERAVMIIMLFNSCSFAGERPANVCVLHRFKSIFLESNKSVHNRLFCSRMCMFCGETWWDLDC